MVAGVFAFAQPAITTFSPSSGPIGTSVTITGSNFSTVPSANTVYFGTVKANVTAASSGSLTVTVPAGANCKPLTVTVNGLTGYSDKYFYTSFTGAGATLNLYSFDTAKANLTDLHPDELVVVDLDNDGKPDIAAAGNYATNGASSFSVLRNITSGTDISFAPKLSFANGQLTYAIAAADIDGDGLQDIIVSAADHNVSVFRNTSTPGNISFAPKVDLVSTGFSTAIVVRDLNLDGLPDIAFTNPTDNTASVYLNNSSVGNISLSFALTLTTGSLPRSIAAADLDGDGKPDLAVGSDDNVVSVFRNTSAAGGTISFAPKLVLTSATGLYSIAFGDLDGDGKTDLISAGGLRLSIYKNLGSPGNIAFGTRTDLFTYSGATHAALGDINGDGKPDIMVSASTCTVYQNQSVSGTISFGAMQYLVLGTSGGATNMAEIEDLNADGRPDMAIGMTTTDHIYTVRNKVNEPVISSFSPTAANTGQTVTINGLNFTGASAVSFGGIPATSFTVVSATQITAIVGNGYSGDVRVTNSFGTSGKPGFIFAAPPVITSFNPAVAGETQSVNIIGQNFNTTSTVSFGGTLANFTVLSSSLIQATLLSGATGNIVVTTNYGSATATGFTFIPFPVISSFTPTNAGNGLTVTITGKNFTGASAVSFGGVAAASFTVVSATSITAVPAAAGASGNVAVTTSYGTGTMAGFTHIPPPTISSYNPLGGYNGTVVTINGTNFIDPVSVSVGGRGLTPTIISSTQVQVTLDAFVTTGDIVVSTQGGTAVATGFLFNPNPTVTALSPAEAGAGMTVNITGTNFTGTTAVNFGAVPAASFVVNSATSITAVVGSGATGYAVVTNSWGSSTNTVASAFQFTGRPIIQSFSPLKGPVGSIVTITGGNFDPIAANNLVSFGPVKANVISASALALRVQVPAFADYEPISVTSNSLTAYSTTAFDISFAGGGTAFNAGSFGTPQDFPTLASPQRIRIVDFDGDGKADVLVSSGANLLFYRNTSTVGSISFAAAVTFTGGSNIDSFTWGDLDGDGKPDIAIGYEDQALGGSVLKNTSSAGNISFTTAFTFATEYRPRDMVIRDFDRDGKPDLAITYGSIAYISLHRNTSGNGNISFAYKLSYSNAAPNPQGGAYSEVINVADFNNDGLPDIVASNDQNHFIILGNQANFNGITMSPLVTNTSFSGTQDYMAVADFNGDGKQDIISAGYSNGGYIFTGAGNYTFTPTTSAGLFGFCTNGDLDGDGKPDFAAARPVLYNPAAAVYAFRNNSTTTIVMDNAVAYNTTTGNAGYTAVGDLDGDGKPEIAYTVASANVFSVLTNHVGGGHLCAGGNSSFVSQVSGTTYQWQRSTGGSYSNISNGVNYSGVSTRTLQLLAIPSSFYGYKYRCLVDGVADATGRTITFENQWTGAADRFWNNPANWTCGVIPDGNTDVSITTGPVELNANGICRKLTISAGVVFTVDAGVQLTITH